jgi:light-regulated signal transduction histidine kinase (bacteriophytochrome)
MNNPGRSVKTLFRNQHKNGQYLWMEGSVINMLHDESINAILFNYRNVTERIEAEEKIINLNTELEEKVEIRTQQLKKSNEELEAFSYSVSHDLRAPLRAVIGYTKMLEEDYSSRLDVEAKRITGIIKNSTLKMGNLIDDLLTFFRTGRNEIVKSTIDNNEMVEEIIKGMDGEIRGNVEWCVHPLPAVRADMNMMRQVWINLISNAVKYSGKSNMPKIEIDSQQLDGQTVFFVKDNGIGFNEKYAGKLFRVFQRLHSSEAYEGTGVGLAIVEKIITKHNGKIWVEAAVNKGATFFFSIPNN